MKQVHFTLCRQLDESCLPIPLCLPGQPWRCKGPFDQKVKTRSGGRQKMWDLPARQRHCCVPPPTTPVWNITRHSMSMPRVGANSGLRRRHAEAQSSAAVGVPPIHPSTQQHMFIAHPSQEGDWKKGIGTAQVIKHNRSSSGGQARAKRASSSWSGLQ